MVSEALVLYSYTKFKQTVYFCSFFFAIRICMYIRSNAACNYVIFKIFLLRSLNVKTKINQKYY